MQTELYMIQGVENILTPALIYYKDEIFENTRKTIEIAGGAERLWPHVKSHKMKKMIEMQKAMGIHHFKCATLAEVKMVAECGAEHILLAYPACRAEHQSVYLARKGISQNAFLRAGR